MALVLTKERLNEFIKTGEVKEQSEIFEEFDITMSVIDSLLVGHADSEGKIHISWGSQRITELKMEKRMKKTADSIPPAKVSPPPYRLGKVRPQAVFGEIILAGAAVFSRKTLHCRGADLLEPVE